MRKPKRSNPNKRPPGMTTQVQAPVKGWTTDSPVEAKEGTALVLDNWFPEADAVRIRRGYVSHATGMSGDVPSLLVFTSATASKLFAANGTDIYDVSSAGAVGAAAQSGLTNAKWQQTMFATSAGQFLVIANGADNVRNYNGTVWSTPSITTLDSTTAINVSSHKKRLWFIPINSTTPYYMPTEAVAGAAAAFPIGAQLKRGGYIMAAGTWSVDAGDGMDDLIVFISSEGEAIIYQGDDPASNFTLVGTYYVGKPLGRRCLYQAGGDLAIVTENGVVPISKAIKTDKALLGDIAITKNVRQAYADAVRRSMASYGWQLIAHDAQNMAILNVPSGGGEDTVQFVLNVLTGAMCRFTGIDAVSWAVFNGGLYFGSTDGKVYQGEYGGNDNGTTIMATMLPAFMHLGQKGRLKHVKGVRPIWFTDVPQVAPQIAIAVDYATPTDAASAQDVSEGFFTWDTSAWDGPDVWYGFTVQRAWRGNGNIGTVISLYTFISIDASDVGTEWRFRLTAWDLLFETGGVI